MRPRKYLGYILIVIGILLFLLQFAIMVNSKPLSSENGVWYTFMQLLENMGVAGIAMVVLYIGIFKTED